MLYKFTEYGLEEMAKNWFESLDEASDKMNLTSRPVIATSDVAYLLQIMKKHRRLYWLMPLIIENAIEHYYVSHDEDIF